MISTPPKNLCRRSGFSGPEVWTVYNSCDIFYEFEVVVCIEMRNGIASVKISDLLCGQDPLPNSLPLVPLDRPRMMVDRELWLEMAAMAEMFQDLEV